MTMSCSLSSEVGRSAYRKQDQHALRLDCCSGSTSLQTRLRWLPSLHYAMAPHLIFLLRQPHKPGCSTAYRLLLLFIVTPGMRMRAGGDAIEGAGCNSPES